MTQLVPGDGAGQTSVAVLLARSASPTFAAGLHWSAWEKSLRIGQEAARIAGEVAEEAYFHHELGVLALCTGNPDRARAELETSISMRGALADKSGAVAGRRALALVEDRSGVVAGRTPVDEEIPANRFEASSPGGPTVTVPVSTPWPSAADTAVLPRQTAPKGAPGGRFAVLGGARRNLVAASAGVLLAGVLGTVVTLGLTSSSDPQSDPGDSTEQSVSEGDDSENELPADEPTDDPVPSAQASSATASTPGPTGSEAAPTGSVSPSPGTSEPRRARRPRASRPSIARRVLRTSRPIRPSRRSRTRRRRRVRRRVRRRRVRARRPRRPRRTSRACPIRRTRRVGRRGR